MRVLRVGIDDWLVLDSVFTIRYLVHHGPAVNRITHETVLLYRIDNWTLERKDRWVIGYRETLRDALDACLAHIDTPRLHDDIHDQAPNGNGSPPAHH